MSRMIDKSSEGDEKKENLLIILPVLRDLVVRNAVDPDATPRGGGGGGGGRGGGHSGQTMGTVTGFSRSALVRDHAGGGEGGEGGRGKRRRGEGGYEPGTCRMWSPRLTGYTEGVFRRPPLPSF